MRKQWFGDSRDYSKWSHILRETPEGAQMIYIAMMRPNELSPSIDSRVMRFFDERKDLGLVSDLFPNRFHSLLRSYKSGDATYFHDAVELLEKAQSLGPCAVFIDPDTGIEPASGTTNRHICIKDLQLMCEALRPCDKLVVYQHAPQFRVPTWEEDCLVRMLHWAPAYEITTFCAREIASDVCFLTFTPANAALPNPAIPAP